MVYTSRVRSRILQGYSTAQGKVGTAVSPSTNFTFSTVKITGNLSKQDCGDTVDSGRGPHTTPFGLVITKWISKPTRLNGTYIAPTGQTSRKYIEYDLGNSWSNIYQPVPSSSFPTMNELAVMAVANMNPSRTSVDVPLFLWELKDLPGMIKHLGNLEIELSRTPRKAPSSAASSYLNYQFGWAPLVKDLLSLCDLAEATENRMRYLEKLAAGKHRIKRSLGKRTLPGPDGTGYSTGGNVIAEERTLSASMWYTAQVSTDTVFPDRSSLQAAAFRAVTGLDGVSLATLWNALPWSWLIDYLGNFGTFLDAHRGYIPWKFRRLCVMRHYTAKSQSIPRSIRPGVTCTPGYTLYERKERAVYHHTPVPGFHDRILSPEQFAILGALALARDPRVRKIAR